MISRTVHADKWMSWKHQKLRQIITIVWHAKDYDTCRYVSVSKYLNYSAHRLVYTIFTNWYAIYCICMARYSVGHPPPSSAEVKERVELCLYSPPGLCGLFWGELYLYTPYLLKCSMRFSPSIWCLSMWRLNSCTDCSEPDHSESNQGLHRQIIMRDLHSSEILRSLEWYLLYGVSGWPISPVPSSTIKKSKRENIAQLKLPDTFVFYGTLSFVWFFKDAWRFRSRFCLRFQANKHLICRTS